MRKLVLTLSLLTGLAASSRSQVTIEIVLDQDSFLRSESLPLRLRITNFSGQTLHLGGEPDWLKFLVEGKEGGLLPKEDVVNPKAKFDVESAKTATLRLDLMPAFKLNEPGRYSVTATVNIPQLKQQVAAEPRVFHIVSGTKLWERDFGVPAQSVPETRKYALQQATYLKQLRLYARVTDLAESRVFNVVPLGALVSFSKPEAQIDRSSNLHVLFQVGARSFQYCVVTPDGELIIRQTHDFHETRPSLRPDQDGRVLVGGGQRRLVLSDLPPARQNLPTDDTAAPK